MHWFWRATIAVVVGWAYQVLTPLCQFWSDFLDLLITKLFVLFRVDLSSGLPSLSVALTFSTVQFGPGLVLAFLVYGILTRFYGPRQFDNETRCRKCQYILKGITEPICPECGERI